ncbi:hypothetical protein ACWGDT_39145 [Streptomyces avermitilis]
MARASGSIPTNPGIPEGIRPRYCVSQSCWLDSRLRLISESTTSSSELEHEGLVVDVSDPLRVFPEADVELDGESGRGLLVVRHLTAELDWFLRADVGKTVRARFAPHPHPHRNSHPHPHARGGAAGGPVTPPLPS